MKIDTSKLLDIAKKNPAAVVTVLKVLEGAAEQQPALITDAVTAIETQQPLGFLKAHPEFALQLAGTVIGQLNPGIMGDVLGALEHDPTPA